MSLLTSHIVHILCSDIVLVPFIPVHTCDISLCWKNLSIYSQFPHIEFQNLHFVLYISLLGISDFRTRYQEFLPLFNNSPY